MLRARLLTAAVAIPPLLLLILYSSAWPLAIFLFVVGLVGLSEYAAMVFAQQTGEKILVVVLGAAVLAATLTGQGDLFGASIAFMTAAALVWVLFTRADFENGLRDIGLMILGILYLSFFLPHFVWLQRLRPDGPYWTIFVVAIGMAGDAAGYFVGSALGRHKLTPSVSPGKTVEGAIGILIGSVIAAVACKIVFQGIGRFLIGEWQVSYGHVMVLALVLGVLGQLGDLTESVMKRAFAIKESGWIFPGHGGVLDRVDSLLFPVAFVYYHLLWLR